MGRCKRTHKAETLTPHRDLSGLFSAYFSGHTPPLPLADGWTLAAARRDPHKPAHVEMALTHAHLGDVTAFLRPLAPDAPHYLHTAWLALSLAGTTPSRVEAAALEALRQRLAQADATLTAQSAAAAWQRDQAVTDAALPDARALLPLLTDDRLPHATRLVAARLALQAGAVDPGLAALQALATAAYPVPARLAALAELATWSQALGNHAAALTALSAAQALAPADPQWLEQTAALWLQLAVPHQAGAALRAAVALAPMDVALRLRAARLLDQLGDPMGVQWLTELVTTAPADAGTRLALARALLHAGAGAAARAVLEKLLVTAPENAQAPVLLGQRARGLGDLSAAATWLQAARQLAPEDADVLLQSGVLALLQGATADAEALLARSLALRPEDTETHLWLAEAARARGDLPAAAQLAQRGVRAQDDGLFRNVIADLQLAATHGALEALTAARETPQRAGPLPLMPLLAMVPGPTFRAALPPVLRLAWLARRMPEPRRRATLDTLARTKPWLTGLAYQHLAGQAGTQGSDAHFHGYPELRAVLLPDAPPLGRTARARDIAGQLQALLTALHGNRSSHLVVAAGGQLQRVHVAQGVRTVCETVQKSVRYQPPAQALAAFDAVFRQFPGSQHPYAFRGELQLWLGDYAAARADFHAALACAMPTRWALYGLGAAATLLGELAEATQWFALATATLGDLGTVYAYRGDLALARGQVPEALVDLRQAVARTPGRIGAWVSLALAQGAAGARDEVTAIFQRLQGLAPELLRHAALDLGMQLPPRTLPEFAKQIGLLRHTQHMLRGNRSSTCTTYFTADGTLHTVARNAPQPRPVTAPELAELQAFLR